MDPNILPSMDTMFALSKTIEAICKISKSIAELRLEDCWTAIADGFIALWRWLRNTLCYIFPFLKEYLLPTVPTPTENTETVSPTSTQTSATPASPVSTQTPTQVPAAQVPAAQVPAATVDSASKNSNVPRRQSQESPYSRYPDSPPGNIPQKRRVHGEARLISDTSSIIETQTQEKDRLNSIRECRRAVIEDVPNEDDVPKCNPKCQAPAPCSGPVAFPVPVSAQPSNNDANIQSKIDIRNAQDIPQQIPIHTNPAPTPQAPQAPRMTEGFSIEEGVNAINLLCALADYGNKQNNTPADDLQKQREAMMSLIQNLGR